MPKLSNTHRGTYEKKRNLESMGILLEFCGKLLEFCQLRAFAEVLDNISFKWSIFSL